MRPIRLAALCLWAVAAPALAHEFWIEPQNYQVETGADLIADLRNGQKFSGVALGYFDRNFERFDMVTGDGSTPVAGRMGDVPALQATAPAEGLLVLVHQTKPSLLTYKSWDKFQAFADHKDFPGVQARHLARGLPEEGFKESYTRFAKSLVAVGHGRGTDHPVGMETEFVVLTNPYTRTGDAIQAQLLYRGVPRPDAQVEMFDRDPGGNVTITLHRTDAQGRVTLPVKSQHVYLLDAVVLREMSADTGAVWETLWAAMTFGVP